MGGPCNPHPGSVSSTCAAVISYDGLTTLFDSNRAKSIHNRRSESSNIPVSEKTIRRRQNSGAEVTQPVKSQKLNQEFQVQLLILTSEQHGLSAHSLP